MARVMDIDSARAMSLEKLSSWALNDMRDLDALVRRRIDRDKALDLFGDISMLIEVLAQRVGARDHGFGARPIKATDEDDDERQEQRAEAVSAPAMDLDVLDDDASLPPAWVHQLVHDMQPMSPGDASRLLWLEMRGYGLNTLRAIVRCLWGPSVNPWQFMLRGMAMTRRYVRHLLRGVSQDECAKLVGETRQAWSARELRVHDELLIRWGVKAPKAADPALKSATAVERSRVAATGNKNRKGKPGKKKKK